MIIKNKLKFKYKCYIAINTHQIRNYLKNIGYILTPLIDTEYRSYGLLCNHYLVMGVPANDKEFNITTYLSDNQDIIDCGSNTHLFEAIAALRDDSDINQWFTDESYKDWILCTAPKWEEGNYYKSFHKATLYELIKYIDKYGNR